MRLGALNLFHVPLRTIEFSFAIIFSAYMSLFRSP